MQKVSRFIVACTFVLALTGCSVAQQQVALTDVQTALTDAQTAITDYGIAKGIAQEAAIAFPNIAAPLAAATAVADGYVAKLQAAVTAAQLDIPTIKALIAEINAEAQTIRLQAAPAVKVVPAPPAT